VIEYLDLEKYPLGTISFVFLLQFSFQHNDSILQKIQKPHIIAREDKLILAYNCIKHLNIISYDSRINSLLAFLNKCETSLGKRMFREWLLNPILDQKILENRYAITERLIQDTRFQSIVKMLSEVYDIERLTRRINLNILHPCEIIQIYSSVVASVKILHFLNDNGVTELMDVQDDTIQRLLECKEFIDTRIDLNEVQKYNQETISRSFFTPETYASIDDLQKKLDVYVGLMSSIAERLNQSAGSDIFRVDNNQVDGHHLLITSKRYNDFKHSLADFEYTIDENTTFRFADVITKTTPSKTAVKISHESFKRINDVIEKKQHQLTSLVKDTYITFLQEFSRRFHEIMLYVSRVVAEIDVYATNARNAFQYKYYKPTIIDRYEKKSYVTGKNLRHPIIERLCVNTEYVPNDVEIGTPDTNGVLLYGTNMVGKSAYMKSIGIGVIMAQCGMFVACEDFVYHPFTQLFTRIPSGDDLFKGQSTFAVEITELRNILKRANSNSLVIGDELASGTESISAVAIVASGIVQLSEKRTSFVFATHLHDLTSLSKIKELKTLKIYHLSVTYDETNKKLTFDRKLKEGQGSTIYGLEVCRALDLNNDFLRQANIFRQELLDINASILNTKQSRYNARHYVDVCGICGESAHEVHHIKQQMHADEQGYIKTVHKNAKHNLLNVCEKCHDHIHNGTLTVHGFVQTTDGIELCVEHKDKSKDIDQLVINLKQQQNMSVAKIKDTIQAKTGEVISAYKINKIILANRLQK
jgi:DNA mismatch repair protein MutS